MKQFTFKWSVGNRSGSFDVDANSQDVAVTVADFLAIDRSGRKNVKVVLTDTVNYV